MPRAIFHRQYDHDLRPAKGACLCIRPSPEPQSFPESVISAAERAGACRRVKHPADTTAETDSAGQR